MLFVFKILPVLLLILSSTSVAGPVIRPSRMVREIYPEVEQELPENSQVCIVGDVVYGIGEYVPSEQPCLKCTCTVPDVRCETIICRLAQPGCKTIHRPNKCCPDYQCECHHNGKMYANGERLPNLLGAECLVCYCRGGEVQCAEVGCYTRDDCEPRFVTGQCCPKYDHCPPRDLSTDLKQTKETVGTGIETNVTSQELNSEEGSGVDIPFVITSTPGTFSIKEILKTTKRHDDIKPQITIKEVIPGQEILEFNPVTYKPSNLDADNELVEVTDEKNDIYNHPPPPVLKIGDQLLFLKQGQFIPEKDASPRSPVITLIGAEGLQIGLGSGETLDLEAAPSEYQSASDANSDDEFIKILYSATTTTANISFKEEGMEETTTKETETKILPEILEVRINTSINTNGSDAAPQEWLKKPDEPMKVSIPLINEKAALPDSILSMAAPSDYDLEELQEGSTETPNSPTFGKIITKVPEISTVSVIEIFPLMTSTSENEETSTEPMDLLEPLETFENISVVLCDTTDIKNQESKKKIKHSIDTEEIQVTTLNALENDETKTEIESVTKKPITEKKVLEILPIETENKKEGFEISDIEINLNETEVQNEKEVLDDIPFLHTTPETREIVKDSFPEATILIKKTIKSLPPISKEEEKTQEHISTILKIDKSNANGQNESKELFESDQESSDSNESTTQYVSLMSNEDASIEITVNDSTQEDPEDLVEMLPGFEMKSSPNKTSNDKFLPDDVELISSNPNEEIRGVNKRDVVKKVLKDTFENPKENIQTELLKPPEENLHTQNDDDEQNDLHKNPSKTIDNSNPGL